MAENVIEISVEDLAMQHAMNVIAAYRGNRLSREEAAYQITATLKRYFTVGPENWEWNTRA
jgi:hypothetical protein